MKVSRRIVLWAIRRDFEWWWDLAGAVRGPDSTELKLQDLKTKYTTPIRAFLFYGDKISKERVSRSIAELFERAYELRNLPPTPEIDGEMHYIRHLISAYQKIQGV